ncbi:hypothetical protein LSAT2_016948 [Lamellibrachia satsuma]|nr:hypothetical protein LSAT2_016948 [Lamellibrachia satsuma]
MLGSWNDGGKKPRKVCTNNSVALVSDQMMVIYKKLRIIEIETRLRFFVCSSLEGALKGLLHHSIITPFGSSINSF